MALVLVASVPVGWRALQLKNERDQRERRIAAASETPHVASGREREIHLALATSTKTAFDAVPLDAVAVSLSKKHAIPIGIDTTALEEAGLGVDTPVHAHTSDMTLAATLDLILRDLDLTYVVSNDCLVITTLDVAHRRDVMIVRAYNVADLVERDSDTKELASALRDVLATVVPTEPEDQRSHYCIGAYMHLLLVRAGRLGHKQVEDALHLIREGMAPQCCLKLPGGASRCFRRDMPGGERGVPHVAGS